MKKKPTEAKREEDLQAVINYLGDNGVTDFNSNIFLHANLEALGGYRNLMDEIRDGNWDTVWNIAELYVSGDMW